MSFQWDSPYYSVSGGSGCPNQVDAYVLDANNAVVGGGVNYDVGGDPVQVFTYTNTTSATATYGLSLVSESGAVPGYIKYVDFAGQATGWTYGYNSGTIYGHANAATAGAGLEAVGSASYAQTPAYGVTPPVVEPTSAAGTTPIFFDTSGNRLATPVVRQSPGIVAPDGGDTTFFGVQTNDGDSYPKFFGTSASAAAAAGVAALVIQAAATATPAQVDSALQSTAIDMGTAGVDAQTGYGLIQADAAVAAAVNATTGTITGTVFLDANGNGTLDAGEAGLGGATAYVDTNNNGQRDGGEPSATVAANGTFTITGVTTGASKVVRVVAPNGYVATVAGRTVAATAGTTTANVALGLFPDAFFGTAGNDAYTLVLDATNKANLDVILAGGATLTAPRTLLPSIIFSPGLGNDALTVSFANGNPVPSGGLTYDGGAGTNTITVNGTAAADTATVFDQQTTFDNVSLLSTNISNETINGMGGTDTVGVTAALASGQTLTVNGGVGTTTFAVRATLPNNGAGYVFDAGTAAGDAGVLTVTVGPLRPAGRRPGGDVGQPDAERQRRHDPARRRGWHGRQRPHLRRRQRRRRRHADRRRPGHARRPGRRRHADAERRGRRQGRPGRQRHGRPAGDAGDAERAGGDRLQRRPVDRQGDRQLGRRRRLLAPVGRRHHGQHVGRDVGGRLLLGQPVRRHRPRRQRRAAQVDLLRRRQPRRRRQRRRLRPGRTPATCSARPAGPTATSTTTASSTARITR